MRVIKSLFELKTKVGVWRRPGMGAQFSHDSSNKEKYIMSSSKSILFFSATLALLLGSARLGLAQGSPLVFYSGQATILTANCSGSGGLCQGGNPAACNNGAGPNNGAGAGSCPACNNGSGPNPVASPGPGIQATVLLCESRIRGIGTLETNIPGTLTVSGTGTGFQYGKTYVSLLYKNPSTATCSRFPTGVPPTLENLSQADSDFASMHLGFWVVNPDGTATLTVVKEATASGLWNYQTVSVREMQPPNTTCFNCGLDPAPQLNALRACGPLTVQQSPLLNCNILGPPL
jgi:hypothetical protein